MTMIAFCSKGSDTGACLSTCRLFSRPAPLSQLVPSDVRPRADVTVRRAREMACRTAERTLRGQPRGRDSEGCRPLRAIEASNKEPNVLGSGLG